MNTAQQITQLIETRLQTLSPEHIELLDDSAQHAGHAGNRGGGHYRLVIVSPQFTGQTPQARHRMVYAALGDLLQREIHALTIKAYTPAEL